MMKILITGSGGKLAQSLSAALGASHDLILTDRDGKHGTAMDITDYSAVKSMIADTTPDMVVHPAAWTHVDGCASDPQRAVQINGFGAQNVAAAAAAVGAGIVYVSTNEVFDGQSERPYYEYDDRAPINAYGYSKFIGERGVAAVNPNHMIVRTAWLFAQNGRNFLHAILDAAAAKKPLRVVIDEIANPTYNDDLADGIARLIDVGRPGTYHLVNEGAVSRYGFARYALDKAGYEHVPIARISRHEWLRPSTPPPYAALHNVAAASVGVTLRPWQAAVDAFLNDRT